MRVITVTVLVIVVTTAQGQKSNWETFRPGKSTQTDVFHLFGTPDHVEIELEWREFVAFQADPRAAAAYTLKYSTSPSRPQLPILNGPLGRSSSALVYLERGQAQYIQWDYCCIYRASAIREWFADEAYAIKRTGKILIGTKSVRHGLLSVTCMSEDGTQCADDVTVLFMRSPQ